MSCPCYRDSQTLISTFRLCIPVRFPGARGCVTRFLTFGFLTPLRDTDLFSPRRSGPFCLYLGQSSLRLPLVGTVRALVGTLHWFPTTSNVLLTTQVSLFEEGLVPCRQVLTLNLEVTPFSPTCDFDCAYWSPGQGTP